MHQPRLLRNVIKGTIALVSIEHILTVISNKQVIVSIIIVISHTSPLPPAGAQQFGILRHIGKGSIFVIVVEVTRGFLPLGKTF